MINDTFRPWGNVSWLLPRIGPHSWQVVGCNATETRSNAILHFSPKILTIERADFLSIEDQPSDYSAQCQIKRNEHRKEFDATMGNRGFIYEATLLQSAKSLLSLYQGIVKSKHIVLDISALPKRFFFPLTRWILSNPEVEDFVVTYMLPEAYTTEQLAYDPENWAHLPTFQSDAIEPGVKVESVIVGAGFVPFGLPELLRHDYDGARVSLLLPFPPGPPQAQRTWQFVSDIEGECRLEDDRRIVRVSAYDVAGCFEQIDAITERGARRTVFAPYGPKPHSLAMCLYAIGRSLDVFYTQPTFYHPNYSTGIRKSDNVPIGYAYALKIGGRNLYELR